MEKEFSHGLRTINAKGGKAKKPPIGSEHTLLRVSMVDYG
jgi:hypothetical protein